ncbi:MAG: efflux RND transporter periplasmic adaptor subunit [Bacteroidia bacterium]|nr:efflux RND transporter periplasmic adaptor subunit [Bacteroidia bacterium]
MKRLLIIGGILVAILIAVVVIVKGSGHSTTKVSTETVMRRNITEVVSASGKVQPELEIKISSDVPGEIVELNVKEGDTVKKGDLLLRINPVIYQSAVERMQATLNSTKANLANSQARLEQAKAQFVNAEAAFNRTEKLFKQGAVSQAEFDQAKATYESSKADVAAASEAVRGADFNVRSTEASLKESTDNLAKTSIYAPVSGTVSKLNKRKGERVVGTAQMEGTEIMRLANLLEMEVLVDVNENDILRVHEGDTAYVEVDAHDNRKFKGIVTEVANSANTLGLSTDQVTNFQVKIRILRESYQDLLDPEHPERYPFLPGMSATVDIQTKRVLNVLTVPIQSVTTRTDTSTAAKGKELNYGKEGPPEEETSTDVVVKDNKVKDSEKSDEPIECVFVYRDGKAILVPVKTGIQDNMYIEIVSGLKENDEIISAPYSAIRTLLRNNAKVEKVSKDQLSAVEE